MPRRTLYVLLLGSIGFLAACSSSERQAAPNGVQFCNGWEHWEVFKSALIEASGRVVDRGAGGRTVSEGQAYALFFSLVANDRETFDRVLAWTEDNLADGDLTARLPAWLWGQNTEGKWGVLDANPASDADLWMAYTLLEAGRLWQEQRYSAMGELLAERILREETADLPGLGTTLLPAPYGFVTAEDWRLNPSYTPLPILQRLSQQFPQSAWPALTQSARVMLNLSVVDGFAPDWVTYTAQEGMQRDEKTNGIGGYDAIRVYLWAGMMPAQLDGRDELLGRLASMREAVITLGVPPEFMTPAGPQGTGSAGFSAALLPYLSALGEEALARAQLLRVVAFEKWQDTYYQQALRLFGQGWYAAVFRFSPDGMLLPFWVSAGC